MRTRLAQTADANCHVGLRTKGALVAGRHRDHWNAQFPQDGQQAAKLFGLAAVGERQHDVVVVQTAQVAVGGFGRVQEVGPSPR